MTTKRDRGEYYRKWAENNREKLRANQARYAREHPDRIKAANSRWYDRTGAGQRDRKYRLEVGQYDAMVTAQNGRCAICQQVPSGKGRAGKLHVDHNHTTGNVRKLLCWRCNLALGQFRDDPATLRRALAYVEEHAL